MRKSFSLLLTKAASAHWKLLLLVMIITLLCLCGCRNAGGPVDASSVSNGQLQNLSGVNSQPAGSTGGTPAVPDKGINPQSASSTITTSITEAKEETIWKLIDENKVEDITPVFETARYILEGGDYQSMKYKNIDYGALSFFKVNGKNGVVDYQGEIKIPYEDNASWCIEGFVDERHCTYDSVFKRESPSGHGIISHYFDLNSQKLVAYDEDGARFIETDYYMKNNYKLSGVYRAAYFKIGKNQFNEDALVMEKVTDSFIVIDDKGKPVTGPDIQEGTAFYNGISAIKKDNKWGFIDLKGNMILDFQYVCAYNFADDVAAVCKDGRWGYINKDGSTYKDFIYDAARSFYKGKAWVKLDGKWQVITE